MKCCSAHAISELQEACGEKDGNQEKLRSLMTKSLQKSKENEFLKDAIINSVEAPLAVIDIKKNLIDFNPSFAEAWKRFTGRKPKSGSQIHQSLPCLEKKLVEKNLQQVFQGNKVSFEISFERKSEKKYFNISLNPFLVDGVIIGAIVFAVDISDKRAAEEHEEKYASIFDQALDGIMIADFEGRILKVNASTCRIFGYSREELLGMNLMDLYDTEYLKSDPIRFDLLKEGKTIERARSMLHKDGRTVEIEYNVRKISDDQTITFYRDVTELRKAQKQIQIAYERINYHINNTPLAVVERDRNLKITQWNKRAEEIYGWKRDEVLGKKTVDFLIHDDEKEKAKEVLTNLQNGILNNKPGENRYYKKDRSIVYCQWYHSLLRDESGQVQTILSFIKDITEQKNFEFELREAEIKFRSLVEQSLAGVYIVQNGKFAYVNPELANILGYTQNEMINSHSIETFIAENDRAMVAENVRARLQGEKDSVRSEIKGIKKDGSSIWAEVFGTRAVYKGEKAIIGTLIDITERKKDAEALQKSEANLHSILDTTDTMYILLDNNFNIISFNQRAAGFAEKTLQTHLTIGDHFAGSFLNGTERTLLFKMKKAMEGKQVDYETPFQQPDNSFNWYHVKMIPISNDRKKFFGLMVAISDITQRKITEQKLRITLEELTQQKVEEQKKITRAIINAQEKERNKIGLELHDNVNQLMASTRIYLTMIRKSVKAKNDLVTKAIEYADEAIEEIRLLSRQQVTPVKNINLQELIQSLTDQLNETTELSISFDCLLPENFRIESELKLNIYRVVQEQLNNIYKHAAAKTVKIRMALKDRHINITVTDNGKGFDTRKKKKGIGISNITNRVESYNGEVIIKSKAGKGCEMNIRIPLSFAK